MLIDFEFACQDNCLDLMVPSDLRQVVAERDRLRADYDALRAENERHKHLWQLELERAQKAEAEGPHNALEIAELRAKLQALKGGAVPEGYALVPVNPPEKLEQFVCNCDTRSGATSSDYPEWQQCYKSMLAAAPQPAEKAQEVEYWKCSSCGATSGAMCNENGCFENERSGPEVQQAERQEPYAWFWSHGSDQGVLTLRQDYEQHKSDYPGMTFTVVYTSPQPAQQVERQEPVAEFGRDSIFNLRKQPNGERWPVGTKLYVAAQPDHSAQSVPDYLQSEDSFRKHLYSLEWHPGMSSKWGEIEKFRQEIIAIAAPQPAQDVSGLVKALVEIARFGKAEGHGRGFTCARMANKALAAHRAKEGGES